jgi:type I restriction enzyme M protein
MESLKRNGRCAIILPNGPLFGGGIAAKVKEKLLRECNLHTIIRLPESVFSPYTAIATNILFLNKGEGTKEIWYYQLKVRNGLKAYNKTNPVTFEDFSDVIAWWNNRVESQNAWRVNVNDIKQLNLDIKNPNEIKERSDLTPHQLIEDIIKEEEKTLDLLEQIKELILKEIPK